MIYPNPLKPGDTVMIVAPAGRIEKHDLDPAIKILTGWGLKIKVGRHVFDDARFFSSDDSGRQEDLQTALDDEQVGAIFCARGGFGTGKIINGLKFNRFLRSPRWVIGFSDITLLHLALHKMNVASILGPVARQIGRTIDEDSVLALKRILFDPESIGYQYPANRLNRTGKASGQVVGGNLTLLCNNIGTSSDIDFREKILFIEDTGERIYAIDRYMNQLQRAGRLNRLSGLIVGNFSGIKNTDPGYGKDVYEVVESYFEKYRFPVAFGFEAGHERRNLSIPYSFQTTLEVSEEEVLIEFRKE